MLLQIINCIADILGYLLKLVFLIVKLIIKFILICFNIIKRIFLSLGKFKRPRPKVPCLPPINQ